MNIVTMLAVVWALLFAFTASLSFAWELGLQLVWALLSAGGAQ